MSTAPGVETPTAAETTAASSPACLRCGLPDAGTPACPRCSMPWITDAPAVVDVLPPGIRAAGGGRRAAVLGVDLAPVVVLATVAVVAGPGLRWVALLVAVAYLAAAYGAWTVTGRTPGRRLLGVRTVDAGTGEPVGLRRLVRRLARGGRPGLLAADLRTGRDPVELPVPGAADLQARRRSVRRDDPSSAASPGERALLAYAGPRRGRRVRAGAAGRVTVGLVLGNGQRYEVAGPLLLGRNPVDAADEGAVLAAWPDMSRRLAKTHLRAEKTGDLLWVTDLGTTGGTALVGPDGLRRTLEPGVPTAAIIGTTIECGGRTVRVVQGA